MRVAIWAAVSTEAQAASDKVSLDVQVTKCREAAQAHGWQEVAAYVVPGESRTRYVNLSDAEREIPQLREMLDAAQAHKFDLVMMYDLNRLRDLLPMVEKTLGAYGVQLYSISQPVEPVSPSQYSPYASDTASMMSGMAAIISRAQINDLRRKYASAMPKRAAKGLPVQAPYGYRRIDNKHAPAQVADEVAAIYRMKDMLLDEGKSLLSIAEALDADSIPTPNGGKHWYPQTVKAILLNPFYAGQVRWGVTKYTRDPRTGKTQRNRKPSAAKDMVTAQGQHVPLWDEVMRSRIEKTLSGRARHYQDRRRNQLSNILRCGICNRRMWVYYRDPDSPAEKIVWYCSGAHYGIPGHYRVPNPVMLELVGQALRDAVLATALDNAAPAPDDNSRRMAELQEQRERLLSAYQAGAIPLSDYTERVAAIEEEIEAGLSTALNVARREAEDQQRREALAMLREDAEYIPLWIMEGDPAEVNQVLLTLLSAIVYDDGQVRLVPK